MKPPQFRYYRARSLREALDLLGGSTPGGKLLAGGQSLVPLLNLRLARPEALIDLNPVRELSYIRRENGAIVIGALTRHREIEFSALIRSEIPILAEAMPQIGHPAIRNRGTVGGSVAHADPAAELPCLLTALDAALVVVGGSGERVIGASNFFIGPYETALGQDEIVKEVRIPLAGRTRGWSFLEFARRHGDFALAETALVMFAENGRARARVAIGGSVERPLRLRTVEQLIENEMTPGRSSGETLLNEVERLALAELHESGAESSDSPYLRKLTGVLTRRAASEAIGRWSRP